MLKKVKVNHANGLMLFPSNGPGYAIGGMVAQAWFPANARGSSVVFLHADGAIWIEKDQLQILEEDAIPDKSDPSLSIGANLRSLIGQDLKTVNLEFK